MTFECEECGKSLATEGGLKIHLDGHRPPPAPVKMASIPEPSQPLETIELPTVTPTAPTPRAPKPGRDGMLVMGLAAATALIFLIGMLAAVRPSLIRDDHKATLAATSHGVTIPGVTTPTTAAPAAGSTTAAPTTPTTAKPAVPTASDTDRAHSLVLQLADFGPGWTVDASGGTDSADSAGSSGFDSDMQACMGVSDSNDTTADADGPDVTNGHLGAATSSGVFATEQDALADFNTINNPSLLPCLKSALTKEMAAEGVPANAVSLAVERYSIPAGVTSTGVRFIVRAINGAASFNLDMVFLQHGRAESFALFSSDSGPVPASVEQALVRRMAAKLLAFDQVSA
ncbi:MAG: C2H2-type zinc finger protein [Actinobacteria bacterium]|nr:C2H2-type zinc finger protein [Actinomycetota bacterium]